MVAQWYAVLVGLVLLVLGILLFGSFSIEGPAYAWLYLIVGLLGIVFGFSHDEKKK